MDLSGSWRAALADDDLRRVAFGLEFDDERWEPIEVPGHWRSTPAFADSDGPLIYRTRFELDAGPAGARQWVVLDGVFYQADVWLDGAYLGDQEGYFAPHAYDVTDLARLGREHVLGVEVSNQRQKQLKAKRAVTGIFGHWDCIDPDDNVGGIWRPVSIERTGPVRIDHMRVVCRDATVDRATVDLHARLLSDGPRTVLLRTTMGDRVEVEHEFSLATGVNDVEWYFGLDDPDLWWPWSLGEQPLVTITVTAHLGDEVSHARTVRTGLRQVAMRNWMLSVNGERLFVKGANLGPTRTRLADATPADVERDITLAREAGLDLVRVHAHVTRPELYDAADRAGMLVWQDFPLQWGYARSVRRQAMAQAEQMVDLLAHHPSIALWCGHNEPITLDIEPGTPFERGPTFAKFAVGQELPSWNKTVLDRWVRRAIEKADPSRPVIAHSGIVPHPPQLDGTDSHLYFGWYHGDERDLPRFAARVPRMVRFVGEFGAQAVPEQDAFAEPDRWPDLDWANLERHHALQKRIFDERVPPASYATFEDWKRATQTYQAMVVKHHVETLRRLKYRPAGGFAVFLLADAHPAISWSLLGHDRAAKAAYQALVDACRPVIVVAERPPAQLAPGHALALDVHVVSDLRRRLDTVEVRAVARWPGGSHGWRWGGAVEADACVRVGTLSMIVPEVAGELVIDLDLVGADDDPHCPPAVNRYTSRIVPL